jgi:hypothetical protein
MLLSISQVIAHNDYIYVDILYFNPLHSINKAYLHTSLFLFGIFGICEGFHFGLFTLVYYIGTGCSLALSISFDIRVARAWCRGELTPPPLVTRPPPASRTSCSFINTPVLLLELFKCVLLRVWVHRGIVLAWVRNCAS